MIKVNSYKHTQLQMLLQQQKQLIREVADPYLDGFHDGIEIVMAVLEDRNPELTDIGLNEEGLPH